MRYNTYGFYMVIDEIAEERSKMNNSSPLRYPGGKRRLVPFISLLIKKSGIVAPIYIEPFAGGAGVGLELLFNGEVDEIVINDYDKAIYSMWRAILTETHKFVNLIKAATFDDNEWRRQKHIYLTQNSKYSLELGFATFYLNRTNRSGILSAGPIGGHNQTGNYRMDVRFNKDDLIKRVYKVASYKHKIHLYNQDVRSFVKYYGAKYFYRAFIYFDPPYYQKGKQLYKNFLNHKDHVEIKDLVVKLQCPWIVTYDNASEIKDMYNDYPAYKYDLYYGVANGGTNSEIIFFSGMHLVPTQSELDDNGIKINFRKA